MTEIKKVVLKLGEDELELTLKEVHELKAILNDAFPEKETRFIPSPYPVYPQIWPYTQWTYTTSNTDDMLWLSNTASE